MRISLFFCLCLLVCACDTRLKKIDDAIYLHDNSSKVWLIDRLLEKGRDYTPVQFEYRELIIFHDNHHAYFYKLNEFGKQRGKMLLFSVDREKNEMLFEGKGILYKFDIIHFSRKKIVLKPRDGSYRFTMVLIPFPEY
jgi:hypothetical protein